MSKSREELGALTSCKGDPPCVLRGFPAPVRRHQQAASDREWDDAHDDEEERSDPLGRQPRRDAGPVPPMNGLTLPDQPHRQSTCREVGKKNVKEFMDDKALWMERFRKELIRIDSLGWFLWHYIKCIRRMKIWSCHFGLDSWNRNWQPKASWWSGCIFC